MTQQLDEEVESMCNISDGIVADAEERGMAKGKEEEKFAIAKRLLDIGVLSIEQIAAGTELPIKEIEALASA